MFGLLKKKLKEAVSKIVRKAEKKEVSKEEVRKAEEITETERKHEQEKKPKRTKQKLVKKIGKKVSRKVEISEEDIESIIWDIQVSLLEADVALEAAEHLCESVKKVLVGRKIEKSKLEEEVKKSFKEAVREVVNLKTPELIKLIKRKKPFLILFLGFNGSGKTTTIAKIGKMLRDVGYSVVFAAADTFRAASIEQIEEHGKKLGIKVIKHKYGADPAAVVFDAVKHAQARGIDVVLADTAGRAHTNAALMEELKKIARVNKPDLKILVLDALTGNDIIEQAKMFDEAIGVDGIVFTKVDVCEKGGAIISAVHAIKKPVLFLGNGQNYEDIEKFDVEKFIENLFEEI